LAKQSNKVNADRCPRGSEWRRWDLHIHTPGTAMEDQFGTWEEYLGHLRAEKDVVVVGVTDYLSIHNYRKLRAEQTAKPLGSISLLIPNIEFRLGPKTAHGHAINIHLLIDPSDPEHCERVEEALSRLTIEYQKQKYSCNEVGLRGLGAAYKSSLTDDASKYAEGVNQYKIDPAAFNGWYESEKWLSSNSMVVISGGNDGPSGLKEDGWAAVQEELWRFAEAIFSGNPKNRVFWLAEDPINDNGALKLGAPKPCLHGSDAHEISKLFRPDDDRFCWIKADPTFEGLRQVLYEPKERVHIGSQAPIHHDRARVISKLSIESGATGSFKDVVVELNCGLVAIIGQKGSGKSALADLLAYAGGVDVTSDRQSFLNRASDFLGETSVTLEWLDGRKTSARPRDGLKRDKTVRYLSQSFVERLCSDDYAGSELTGEIENVIFGHLDPTDTLNTSNFADLRELRTQQLAKERLRAALKIKQLISEDETLRETIKALPGKKDRIAQLGEEQKSLVKQVPAAENAQEAQAQTDLGGLRQQLQKMQTTVAGIKQVQLRLQQLQDQIAAFKIDFENRRVDFRAQATTVGVSEAIFDVELVIKGEQALTDRASEIEAEIVKWEGKGIDDLDSTIAKVNAQIKLAESLVATDKAKRDQIQQLQKRIATISQEITRVQADVVAVESTNVARSKAIREARLETYAGLFKSWRREQSVLEKLYEPIRDKLLSGVTEEKMLDFYIRWDIDLDDWLEQGAALFDQRKGNPFGSAAQFRELVQSTVFPGWKAGDSDKIREGMDKLLDEFRKKDIESYLRSKVSHSTLLEWVFGYEHIKLNYGLRYQGAELDKLSPGTKGVVLLILYLAMDSDDTRPLIVDQPEENLDSESIFSLLSHYFRSAKVRRQVIVITHNPNLVVNTDADQVIIATAERKESSLPHFHYQTGSLESTEGIRESVCRILEGGKMAFLQRERRYAIPHQSA
jgi:ABC-type lipoprotein export system ATPase subunit